MTRLLVIGAAKEETDDPLGTARLALARAIGYQVVKGGYSLAGGCRTTIDREAAKGAEACAQEDGLDPEEIVRSWISGSTEPIHETGEIIRSQLVDWYRIPQGLEFPEAIRGSDAVILIGGGDGTLAGATWSRFAGKPLIPAAALGLAAEEVFNLEVSRFNQVYESRVRLEEYQSLNRYLSRYDEAVLSEYAADVVALAARLVSPTDVFVIMSLDDDPSLIDAFDTFEETCRGLGLTARRLTEVEATGDRIVPEILEGIRRAAFVIADVSVHSPNVFYELGYAQALGRRVVVTAREGTELPFDIADVPVQFWNSQKELREKLRARIQIVTGQPSYGEARDNRR